MSNEDNLQDLIALRKEIHQHPELSGEEAQTAKRIKSFIKQYNPSKLIEGIGGHGFIAQFKGEEDGPSVTIRAELDALPIQESSDLDYKSEYEEKGHLCGHDGHMTMVAALAPFLSENKPRKGAVNLLFQPAEETGQGAREMLNDDKINEVDHDYIFALHNLPGFKQNSIIIKKGGFAAASKGLIIKLKGKTSHAAEPKKGNSPAPAAAEIINKIEHLPEKLEGLENFSLVTVVHAKIGDRAFGTTPGKAVVMATLRAYLDKDLDILEDAAKTMCEEVADRYGLKCAIEETEVFSSTMNNEDCVGLIEEAAKDNDFERFHLEKPFRWSEDFGLFSQTYKGAMFGLGAGEDTPALHNPDYDFPDEIMKTGITMFESLIKKLVY